MKYIRWFVLGTVILLFACNLQTKINDGGSSSSAPAVSVTNTNVVTTFYLATTNVTYYATNFVSNYYLLEGQGDASHLNWCYGRNNTNGADVGWSRQLSAYRFYKIYNYYQYLKIVTNQYIVITNQIIDNVTNILSSNLNLVRTNDCTTNMKWMVEGGSTNVLCYLFIDASINRTTNAYDITGTQEYTNFLAYVNTWKPLTDAIITNYY